MTYMVNKNTKDYSLHASWEFSVRALRNSFALASLTLLSSSVMPTFYEGIGCSVPEQGQPFLYDGDADVVVGHPFSSIKGDVIFQAFSQTVLSVRGFDPVSENVIGRCRFSVDGKQHFADAFPSEIAGTYKQLNPEVFSWP
jgi:hypothetical protein